MGSNANLQPQLTLLDPNRAVPDRGRGLCPPPRGPKVRGQPVQAPAQQEAAAGFQVLLPPVEDLGVLLHTSGVETVLEAEAGRGIGET